MKKRRRHPGEQPPARRWHIPPPLIHGSEALEGGALIQELDSEAGVLLWQAFRDVMLWAMSEPDARTQVFSPDNDFYSAAEGRLGGAVDPRLTAGLRVVQQLVQDPATAREERVAAACRQLSEWALEEGLLGTSLAFAQNAALAHPGDAAAAFWVATVAGRVNDHARAEVWFRRAIGVARQSRDWRMYSRSFGGLGNLYIRRGNLPEARRLHTRALRGARRGGMRREQAAALHDLFGVAVETGATAEAERLARQAFDAYDRRNRRLSELARDVASFWVEQGHFARALSVLQATLPRAERPGERIVLLATIVRAAAGHGDTETALGAAAQVWHHVNDSESPAVGGPALLELARGLLALGDHRGAGEAAERAIASATAARERKVAVAAETLLEGIRDGVAAVPAATPAAGIDRGRGDQLAADLIRTLEGIAGATD
jgi:tetratricopeptide (TPR) repeat protein